MKGQGENLAYDTNKKTIEELTTKAMQGWYDEIKTYNYAAKSCDRSCHYTQMVWAETRKIGCAMNKCDYLYSGRAIRNAWYLACFYDPMGNDVTEYPYLTGKACSACLDTQQCEDGLCTGKGKRVCENKNKMCEKWASEGECDRNPKWMTKDCRKACKLCDSDDVIITGTCTDEINNTECERYRYACDRGDKYMMINCKKTCGFC